MNGTPMTRPIIDLKPGDFITVKIRVSLCGMARNTKIDHYGIYVGDGKVVHNRPGHGWMMAGEGGGVESCSLEEFIELSNAERHRYWAKVTKVCGVDLNKTGEDEGTIFNEWGADIRQFSAVETVERAIARVGEKEYHFKNNNSEHFILECRFGIRKSYQMQNTVFTCICKCLEHLNLYLI